MENFWVLAIPHMVKFHSMVCKRSACYPLAIIIIIIIIIIITIIITITIITITYFYGTI